MTNTNNIQRSNKTKQWSAKSAIRKLQALDDYLKLQMILDEAIQGFDEERSREFDDAEILERRESLNLD